MDKNLHVAIAAIYLFFLVTAEIILIVGMLRFSITKIVTHLYFHHFFIGSASRLLSIF